MIAASKNDLEYPKINLGSIQLEIKLMTDELSIFEITLGSGANSGVHFHTRERETFVILHGEIDFLINNNLFKATARQTITIQPNAVHCFSNTSSLEARALLILNPGGLAQYFLDLQELLNTQGSEQQIQALGQSYGLQFL